MAIRVHRRVANMAAFAFATVAIVFACAMAQLLNGLPRERVAAGREKAFRDSEPVIVRAADCMF